MQALQLTGLIEVLHLPEQVHDLSWAGLLTEDLTDGFPEYCMLHIMQI